jgi:hypothetical protein
MAVCAVRKWVIQAHVSRGVALWVFGVHQLGLSAGHTAELQRANTRKWSYHGHGYISPDFLYEAMQEVRSHIKHNLRKK